MRPKPPQVRFGIGEWYGLSFADMAPSLRKEIAEELTARSHPVQRVCPPRSSENNPILCNKIGGVCSLRQYISDDDGVRPAPGSAGSLRVVCPNRFAEGNKVYSWIGEMMVGDPDPLVAAEIGFLERESRQVESKISATVTEDVGRIDHVLVHPNAATMRWCALEVQAVYFSGYAMGPEFKAIAECTHDGIPFPAKIRRPDYRSSGPKRLMPQLQIKVPSLRRWGKKMVVLVDVDFYQALGTMDDVPHTSNCDIVWFIVRFEENDGQFNVELAKVQRTTLERAVEGLTAGTPVSLETFEDRLKAKIKLHPTLLSSGLESSSSEELPDGTKSRHQVTTFLPNRDGGTDPL